MELSDKNSFLNSFRKLKSALVGLHPGTQETIRDQEAGSGFLPEFCNGWVVFNVVVIAEMLAIVITLVTRRIFETPLHDLLYISILVQWIALGCTAALCYTRKYLNRLPNLRALIMAYLMMLCVTWLVGEGSLWLLWFLGKTNTAYPEWHVYFHIQNLSVSAVVAAIALRYFLAKHELKQRTLSEAKARLQALQSRIRPHFVFNSLNIIASLTRSDPSKAEDAIEDMADLFRMMLNEDENLVPVKKEIEIAKKYFNLEALRLDNRLHAEWDIGKFPRKAIIPVLTLQPLLENAIRHGIEPIPEGGNITVRLWEQNDSIHIRISNPIAKLKGSSKVKDLYGSHDQALENIRKRFLSHYGDDASLETTKEKGRFTVSVNLPLRGDKP